MSAVIVEPQKIMIEEFWGGLNLSGTVGENESPDCLNVTTDESGDLFARLGHTSKTPTGQVHSTFLSHATSLGDLLIIDHGDDASYKSGADSETLIKDFTDTFPKCFVDFNGKLIMGSAVDGIYSWTGTALATLTTVVKPHAMAVWDNKIWAAVGNTLYWCAAGDETSWTTGTDFVKLRAPDDAELTALLTSAGQGLLAYKHRSTHRVYDSTTGANSLLDGDTGAAGPRCVVTFDGMAYSLSGKGVYVTDGLQPLECITTKVSPIFEEGQLPDLPDFGLYPGFDAVDVWCMGASNSRIYASFHLIDADPVTLEIDPRRGGIFPHDFMVRGMCFVPYEITNVEQGLWGAADSTGVMYWLYSATGTHAFRWKTATFELPFSARFKRARVVGRGTFDALTSYLNFQSTGDARALAMPTVANPSWDDIWELGVGNAIAVRIDGTVSSTGTWPTHLLGGTNPIRSGHMIRTIQLDYIPLGRDIVRADAS